MRTELLRALVHGGMGIQGIEQTPFYKWLISDDGLSQFGIEKSEPRRLLDAYMKNLYVRRRKNIIELKFGQVAKLKLFTPHPANNTGQLHIDSWLTWALDARTEPKGYVPRTRIESSSLSRKQKSKLLSRIRVSTAGGGLMLGRKFLGSKGRWQIPRQYADYDIRWLRQNAVKIQQRLIRKTIVFFRDEIR